MRGPGSQSFRRIAGTVVGTLVAAFIAVPAASAATTPFVDIHSAGPLSDIYIGNDLSCQVRSGGFSSTEFFPNASGPSDCGTFLDTGTDDNTPELLGPDFGNHAGGTNTTGKFTALTEVPVAPVSQTFTGSGSPASPYQVTTVVTSSDPDTQGALVFQITEVDTYVVGNDFYRSDVTVANIGSLGTPAMALYHAADCQLRGSDNGFGANDPPLPATQTDAACATTVLNNPPSAHEEFQPITPSADWAETTSTALWGVLGGANLPGGCGSCRSNVDNATAIEWTIPNGLGPGGSQTFSWNTVIVDTVPAGGFSFSGAVGSTVGGTVATITDPNTSATPSAYTATINWGDGSSSQGTINGSNGSFTVTGNHAYTTGGQFPVAVTITSVGTSQGSSTVTDSATITATPATVLTGAPTVSPTSAGFSGSANPNGLPTTALFQYGLDPKYSGGGPVVYPNSTPAQNVGSDFASHIVSASVAGLVPNALYHVRLVATNSAGSTFGPDVTFTTGKLPAPGSPTLGKTVNISLVSGLILVKIHGVFVPLTELTQIPTNTVINALHGTLSLTTAAGSPAPAHDAAAKGKKPKKHKTPTQKGNFGGAVFKISQTTRGAGKGLVTLAIVEGAGFKGAPTYATCKKHKAADPSATAASAKTLQLLHASAKGKFRTKGRYSAATVLGTKWTVADRCDGTLTHDITDSVSVNDFVRRKTIILHAGQSYLAKARK